MWFSPKKIEKIASKNRRKPWRMGSNHVFLGGGLLAGPLGAEGSADVAATGHAPTLRREGGRLIDGSGRD